MSQHYFRGTRNENAYSFSPVQFQALSWLRLATLSLAI